VLCLDFNCFICRNTMRDAKLCGVDIIFAQAIIQTNDLAIKESANSYDVVSVGFFL